MPNVKKVFPRNLTARADYLVSGNPVITRPEDAVANCFPGLELDVRNLDRRFFPGLVFEFVAQPDPGSPGYNDSTKWGALLSYVDVNGDPDLLLNTDEARRLNDQLNNLSFPGRWYIAWIEQGGKRIPMSWLRPDPTRQHPTRRQKVRTALDGLYVWRLVRALEIGPVTIALERRDEKKPVVVLHGWRRRFTDERTGVLNGAYQPGELLQSLCSPWTHDFRDCACHYWASNHPDVVLGEVRRGEPELPDGRSTDTVRGTMPLDWLRSERRRDLAGGAHNTIPKNRPFQYDHFQINQDWQKLAVVLQDQELDTVYTPRLAETAVPFPTTDELVNVICEKLAPLEMVLAIEYVYAGFTLLNPDVDAVDSQKWPTIADDLVFLRHYLLLTAHSEMLHLRWANELLWELFDSGIIDNYEPVLKPALEVPAPTSSGFRSRKLQSFSREAVDGFLFVEDPGGFIDSTYGRVIATLRQPKYPPHLADLAGRVATDGIEHFSRFKDMKTIVSTYAGAEPPPYLRDVQLTDSEGTRKARTLFESILADLARGYSMEAKGRPVESGKPIGEARATMLELYQLAEDLARHGIGIPFFEAI